MLYALKMEGVGVLVDGLYSKRRKNFMGAFTDAASFTRFKSSESALRALAVLVKECPMWYQDYLQISLVRVKVARSAPTFSAGRTY